MRRRPVVALVVAAGLLPFAALVPAHAASAVPPTIVAGPGAFLAGYATSPGRARPGAAPPFTSADFPNHNGPAQARKGRRSPGSRGLLDADVAYMDVEQDERPEHDREHSRPDLRAGCRRVVEEVVVGRDYQTNHYPDESLHGDVPRA